MQGNEDLKDKLYIEFILYIWIYFKSILLPNVNGSLLPLESEHTQSIIYRYGLTGHLIDRKLSPNVVIF